MQCCNAWMLSLSVKLSSSNRRLVHRATCSQKSLPQACCQGLGVATAADAGCGCTSVTERLCACVSLCACGDLSHTKCHTKSKYPYTGTLAKSLQISLLPLLSHTQTCASWFLSFFFFFFIVILKNKWCKNNKQSTFLHHSCVNVSLKELMHHISLWIVVKVYTATQST